MTDQFGEDALLGLVTILLGGIMGSETLLIVGNIWVAAAYVKAA